MTIELNANPSEETLTEMREWISSRPEAVRSTIREWPPGANVRAKPGVWLVCPAPGVVGQIMGYVEHLDENEQPTGGCNLRVSDGLWAAECRAEQLELVDDSTAMAWRLLAKVDDQ